MLFYFSLKTTTCKCFSVNTLEGEWEYPVRNCDRFKRYGRNQITLKNKAEARNTSPAIFAQLVWHSRVFPEQTSKSSADHYREEICGSNDSSFLSLMLLWRRWKHKLMIFLVVNSLARNLNTLASVNHLVSETSFKLRNTNWGQTLHDFINFTIRL